MEGKTGPASTAAVLRNAKRRFDASLVDDRPLSAQVEDLRDRVTVALELSGLDRCPADIFYLMTAMQRRRERHGLRHDPLDVIQATFAMFCPAAEGR